MYRLFFTFLQEMDESLKLSGDMTRPADHEYDWGNNQSVDPSEECTMRKVQHVVKPDEKHSTGAELAVHVDTLLNQSQKCIQNKLTSESHELLPNNILNVTLNNAVDSPDENDHQLSNSQMKSMMCMALAIQILRMSPCQTHQANICRGSLTWILILFWATSRL